MLPLDEKYEELMFVDTSIDDKMNSEMALRMIQALQKIRALYLTFMQ